MARAVIPAWTQVHKLMVIVQLLLGDIPDRGLFRQAVLRKPLQPYLRLTHCADPGRASASASKSPLTRLQAGRRVVGDHVHFGSGPHRRRADV